MGQVLTLRELGEKFGIDVGQLKRLVRVGSLPEATKENSPSGKRWVIPVDKVEEIADRHGWEVSEINLQTAGDPTVSFVRSPDTDTDTDRDPDPDQTVNTAPDNAAPVNTAPMALTPLRPTQPPLPPPELKVKRLEPPAHIPALADILNEDLLTRLLGAHEDKATAQARVQETERALTSLTASHRHLSMQLSEERKEREILAERLRDERTARFQSDAKVAELHERVSRETAIAESEQRARQSATDRSVKAESDAATALGSMGFISRRRYERKVNKRS